MQCLTQSPTSPFHPFHHRCFVDEFQLEANRHPQAEATDPHMRRLKQVSQVRRRSLLQIDKEIRNLLAAFARIWGNQGLRMTLVSPGSWL
jgi:hypothetical protein